jgi:hypothetical protein
MGFMSAVKLEKLTPFSVHLWQKSVRILLLSHFSRWYSPQSPCTLLKARAHIRVISKVTLYPLFQWSTQSMKNLVNLNTRFKNYYCSCTGRSSEIYVATSETVRKNERQGKTWKLSSSPKWVEKLVWVPAISFCKIFILSFILSLMRYYAKTGRSCSCP